MTDPTITSAPTDALDTPARRVRVSSEDAAERLVATTIIMLREVPFTELSVRTIAARADLNKSTIERCFGSIEGLFMEVCNRMVERTLADFADSKDMLPFLAPDVMLSVRFRGWLVAGGVDPTKLRFVPGNVISRVMSERQQRMRGVSPLTAQTFVQILTFLAEGYTVFNETHTIDDEVRGNILLLIDALGNQLPAAQAVLGWDDRPAVEIDG